MKGLTVFHSAYCKEYRNIIKLLYSTNIKHLYDVPFFPVRLFKKMELRSIDKENIFKIIESSGTTSQKVSRIFLDKDTSSNQTRALVSIMRSFIGKHRCPMIVVDSSTTLSNRNMYSARSAAIMGFSIMGSKMIFALNEEMVLNRTIISDIEKIKNQNFFIFGFTSIIWEHLVMSTNFVDLNLSNAVLIHGGGWKKLNDISVNNAEFRKELTDRYKINKIYDYYGMAEQTGSIFMECEMGHLHSSIFSDVLIRNPVDFKICKKGEEGIIQVLSVLPMSYPGHSLLTEDKGVLLGEDDCSCGRLGKYFQVNGRIELAEIRGCSDVSNS